MDGSDRQLRGRLPRDGDLMRSRPPAAPCSLNPTPPPVLPTRGGAAAYTAAAQAARSRCAAAGGAGKGVPAAARRRALRARGGRASSAGDPPPQPRALAPQRSRKLATTRCSSSRLASLYWSPRALRAGRGRTSARGGVGALQVQRPSPGCALTRATRERHGTPGALPTQHTRTLQQGCTASRASPLPPQSCSAAPAPHTHIHAPRDERVQLPALHRGHRKVAAQYLVAAARDGLAGELQVQVLLGGGCQCVYVSACS